MKREAELLLHNIGQLVTLASNEPGPRRGESLEKLGIVSGGAIACADGKIVAVGREEDVLSAVDLARGGIDVDANGSLVMPGFVDCHTHTVFADYRVEEYEWRVLGTSYEEIAARGGGIAKSVLDLRSMSEEELFARSSRRVEGCIAYGTTTLEIKSGYGLDLKNELKQLRVIKALAGEYPLLIVPTFLGAHSVPPEYRGRKDEYIDLIVNEMIPAVVENGLAEFIDVFSEKGVFEVHEAERILRAGLAAGLKVRLHADEIHDTGSAELAVEVGAVSADHLTKINDSGMRKLAASDVIAVLLPGTSFGLPSLDFARARRMIESGVAIAIASDFNPGSSPSESMPMMLAIACSHMGMSPAEAITASTYNAACVLGREDVVGSLEPGKRADFIVLDAGDFREIPYRFGINPVRRVFIAGREWRARNSSEAQSW